MHVQGSIRAASTGWIAASIVVMLAALLIGCSSLQIVRFDEPSEKERRASELRSLLDQYARDFSQTVELAANEIVDLAPDLETKRATVHWKLRVIPRVKELSREQTSQGETLLALWLYTETMFRYYERGEGRDLFGAQQPIAVAASRELGEKIEGVARQVLDSEEDFAKARVVIEDYALRYAQRRRDSGATDYGSVEAGIQELTASAGALDWIPSFSLEVFNPFAGLNESAAAIRYLTDKTNALLDDVNTELPWQIELLLYDIERRDTVRNTRADLKRFSESAVSLAETADRLPDDMKGVVRTTLDEIDVKQEDLRETLQQTEDALARAEGLVSGLRETAAYLTDAGRAWDATFQTLGLGEEGEASAASDLEPGASAEAEGRPFDILDYRDTARELGSVAVELRGLVLDIQALAGTGDDDAPLGRIELAAQTAAAAALGEGRSLVDHAAVRLFQLVGVVFVLAILYRFVVARLAPRPKMTGA